MSDERIPFLNQAFTKAEHKLDDDAFVREVIDRIPARYAFSHPLLVGLFLVPGLWFVSQIFGDAPRYLFESLSQPLTASLSQDSLVGGILTPLNSLVGVLGFGLAVLCMACKRLFA